jgi:hypothetical protein
MEWIRLSVKKEKARWGGGRLFQLVSNQQPALGFGAGWVFLKPSDSARSRIPGDSIEVERHGFHEI